MVIHRIEPLGVPQLPLVVIPDWQYGDVSLPCQCNLCGLWYIFECLWQPLIAVERNIFSYTSLFWWDFCIMARWTFPILFNCEHPNGFENVVLKWCPICFPYWWINQNTFSLLRVLLRVWVLATPRSVGHGQPQRIWKAGMAKYLPAGKFWQPKFFTYGEKIWSDHFWKLYWFWCPPPFQI